MKWLGFFLLLQCHNWKSNSRQLSGTSLRDLNSGHFTNWATAATAATNSLSRHKNELAFSEGLIRFFISRSLAPVCDQSWDEIIRSEFKNGKNLSGLRQSRLEPQLWKRNKKCLNTIGDTFHGSMITFSTADYIMYTLDTSLAFSFSHPLSPTLSIARTHSLLPRSHPLTLSLIFCRNTLTHSHPLLLISEQRVEMFEGEPKNEIILRRII